MNFYATGPRCQKCAKPRMSAQEKFHHWRKLPLIHSHQAFNPSVTWDNVDFAKSPAMYDMPVTSAICNPVSGSSVKPEKGATHVEIKGYAWSGQGNRIARVDLTADGGKTWWDISECVLHFLPVNFATFFEITIANRQLYWVGMQNITQEMK